MSHYGAVAVKIMPPKQEEVLHFTDFTEILKGKENPWFLLMYCDKYMPITNTVNEKSMGISWYLIN